MNIREKGFLLLTSSLGDAKRKPLTAAQLRTLAKCMKAVDRDLEDRELRLEDLTGLGLRPELAGHILGLLEDGLLLEQYMTRGAEKGCVPLSRISPQYPVTLRSRLGANAPGCIWLKGDAQLLTCPAVALVGSRDIGPDNQRFAEAVGRQAAKQGYVLISGNARGSDKIAQSSCLEAGGRVISIVADCLYQHHRNENILYVSEDGFDLPFHARRALSRNRLIHSLGSRTFVAQSSAFRGGTWEGTTQNLQAGWSPVFCFQDGSQATLELIQRGAEGVNIDELGNFSLLSGGEIGLFD